MKIDKGANAAVVVRQAWANLHAVKMFLRQGEGSQTDIRGVDESHILFANVLDAEDSTGIWIGQRCARSEASPHTSRQNAP